MSIEVVKIINKVIQPIVKKISVNVIKDGTNHIPDSIGLNKGDLIVFRGEGDPVRFSAGTSVGKVMVTDPTSETGWSLGDGGGGGGASSSVTLHNATGGIVETGTIVKISSGVNFVKATSTDTTSLFIVSEDCSDDEDVDCYSVRNTICLVKCDTVAISVGDSLVVSSTSGVATKKISDTQREIATALTAKAGGNGGTVKALLTGVNPYGVLEVKDGGTGATTAESAWSALGGGSIGKKNSLSASDIPSLDASKITSGTFDADRIPSLNASKITSGVLPIEIGGTNAATVENARINLGLTDSGWITLNNIIPCYYRKCWNTVMVVVPARNVNYGDYNLGKLPSGYRPKYKIFEISGNHNFSVDTDGTVVVVQQDNPVGWFEGHLTFLVA